MRHVISPTDSERQREEPALSILLVDAGTRDVSSTEVRHRLAVGSDLDELVPPSVRSYITRNRLYGGRQPGQPLAWGTT
jgi:nicotinic acid mononucleotide adenylyltransferase